MLNVTSFYTNVVQNKCAKITISHYLNIHQIKGKQLCM